MRNIYLFKRFSSLILIFYTFGCVTNHSSSAVAKSASETSPAILKDEPKDDKDSTQIDTTGSSVIVKPYKDAIDYIEEDCRGSYEVLSKKQQSAEMGVAVPIGKDDSRDAHWFVRYRCKGGM